MINLPPLPQPQDKIVIVRKRRELAEEVRFSPELWRQMQFQMDRLELSLDAFIIYAVELYIDELLKRETQEKKWIDFSEGQYFTTNAINTSSKPIDIPLQDSLSLPDDIDDIKDAETHHWLFKKEEKFDSY